MTASHRERVRVARIRGARASRVAPLPRGRGRTYYDQFTANFAVVVSRCGSSRARPCAASRAAPFTPWCLRFVGSSFGARTRSVSGSSARTRTVHNAVKTTLEFEGRVSPAEWDGFRPCPVLFARVPHSTARVLQGAECICSCTVRQRSVYRLVSGIYTQNTACVSRVFTLVFAFVVQTRPIPPAQPSYMFWDRPNQRLNYLRVEDF